MVRLRFGFVTFLLSLLAFLPQVALAQNIGDGPHVPATLVAETDTPAPGGTVTLAFASTPAKGWHAYWENPGDAGIVTRAEWTLPDGVSAGPLVYPVPERLDVAGIMNYVYERPFTVFADLKIPAGLAPGTKLPVKVHRDYLVCTLEVCVPESDDHDLVLTVGDGAIPADRRAQFDAWRRELPRPLGAQATWQSAGGVVRLAIPYPRGSAVAAPYFFPLGSDVFDQSAAQKIVRDGDRLVIEVPAKSPEGSVDGVLAVGKGQGFRVTAAPGTVPPASAQAVAVDAAPAADTPDAAPLWRTALFAFLAAILGGLILNIMPCVFPILSLKALSLAKANHAEASPRAEALAYTAGVVTVCLALGGIMLALRAGGTSVGWAWQLQDPRVLLVLLLMVTAIAFNLAGLFELSTPDFINRIAARGTGGDFMTGALAAFVATPCAGPFMAGALGAALVLPWPAALAVFAGLGLGIALPFLLLGFVPPLRRMLPRPGAWMDGLRKILSLPMFVTAIGLLWVLGRQIGVNGMATTLLVVLGVAVILWAGGRRQARGAGFGPVAPLLLLAATVAGIWIVSGGHRPEQAQSVAEGAEPFSEARLAALRGEGRPVFAYFTADWCLTCKVNEKAVIETQAVAKALADNKVAVLVGDWTDGDPALGRFIEAHNRAGVPLYLWYRPGGGEPQVLPQILTQAMLQDLAAGR
ncbi:MAG: protein-disulfide reductase DsbD family protein [Pseudomonadota bacterium]